MKSAPHYTWASKGWGGAEYAKDASGKTVALGLDCSGLVSGMFSRYGWLEHSARNYYNAERFRVESVAVSEADLQPLDLVFWGGSTANHIGIVAIPNKLIFESGGGGREAVPTGEYREKLIQWGLTPKKSEWPPKGRIRFSSWNWRTADRIGFGRFAHRTVSEADKALIQEWEAHLSKFKNGERVPLSANAIKAGYRPVYNDYPSTDYGWKKR